MEFHVVGPGKPRANRQGTLRAGHEGTVAVKDEAPPQARFQWSQNEPTPTGRLRRVVAPGTEKRLRDSKSVVEHVGAVIAAAQAGGTSRFVKSDGATVSPSSRSAAKRNCRRPRRRRMAMKRLRVVGETRTSGI